MMVRWAIGLFAAAMIAAILLADWSPDWRIVPGVLAGWFVADLASGLVHMLMDYLPCRANVGLDRLYHYDGWRGSDEYNAMRRQVMARINPVERLLFDFKVHHPRPDVLGRRSLYHQVWSTILFMALPIALVIVGIAAVWTVPGWIMAGAIAFVLGGAFSQYFHGTLHRTDNPWAVRAMRKLGLLMTPEAHERHHDSLQRDFATINGWSNRPLNLLFRMLRASGRLRDEGLVPN